MKEKTREKILRLIKENPEVTTAEIAEKFSITSKGTNKGGHWEII